MSRKAEFATGLIVTILVVSSIVAPGIVFGFVVFDVIINDPGGSFLTYDFVFQKDASIFISTLAGMFMSTVTSFIVLPATSMILEKIAIGRKIKVKFGIVEEDPT